MVCSSPAYLRKKKYSPTNLNMLLPIQILLVKGGQVLLKKSSNIKTQKGKHYHIHESQLTNNPDLTKICHICSQFYYACSPVLPLGSQGSLAHHQPLQLHMRALHGLLLYRTKTVMPGPRIHLTEVKPPSAKSMP